MKFSFGVVALLVLTIAQPARAVPGSPERSGDERPEPNREATEENAPTTPANGAEAEPSVKPGDSEAELAEELLTQDAEASDLAWLYSNADEYTSSDVTGTPLPAPGLPGPGGGTPRSWDPRWRKFSTGTSVSVAEGFGWRLAPCWFAPVPVPGRGRAT